MSISFVEAVTPSFKALLSAEGRFRLLNLQYLSVPDILRELERLEELEQAVMIAWAESTVLINTGFYEDVKKGRVKLTLSDKKYLIEILPI